MRRRTMPQASVTHPNVTPLIDVVTVLIVFFMLVARIGIYTGADPTIRIPATIRGGEIKDMGNTLTVNVRAGPRPGEPLVTALVRNDVRELKLIDPANNVRQFMVELQRIRYGQDMAEGGTGANADNPGFKVIIRAEEDLDYAYLEPVLQDIASAGVSNVNFNTRRVYQQAAAAAQ